MKKLVLAALVITMPMAALAATWKDVPLVDHNCAEKVKANPDAHTTACLLQCASSGYGILDHGKWIALDKVGDEKALAALKATKRKDHVRVDVTGEQKGSVIHVASLRIPD
jgi:hypothetical protein